MKEFLVFGLSFASGWDFLRDPMWQFAGALFAVFALVVAVIAIFAQVKRKQLSYEIVNNIPLLTLEEEIAGKLRVLLRRR
jgi:membrane protein YdbS with pleckstrin-like domain